MDCSAGVRGGEREGEKEGAERKKNLKCENGWDSEGFQNRTQDFITHTWTAEGMEKPLLVCAHVHVRTHMRSAAGLVREIIRIMLTK